MEIQLRQPYSFYQLGRRANQEDARFPDVDVPQDFKPAFIVCDGVGGQDRGEVASRIIANTIGEEMQKVDLSFPFTVKDFELIVSKAYGVFQKNMRAYGTEMATTLTFACFHRAGVFLAHIGDSRIYHIRPGVGILYQSDDHSLVNALVHSGNLTPEEAQNHPQSNIITRCIGKNSSGSNGPVIDTFQVTDVAPNDYFLLCTDGVTSCVANQQLYTILSSSDSDREKMKALSVICEGSSDNNTAYLIGIEDVIYDEHEIVSIKDDSRDETGQSTVPLNIPTEVIIEASIKNHRSIGNQISDFFTKLF